MYRVEWSACAHEDIAALFDYVAEQATPFEALDLCERLLGSTEKLPLPFILACTKPPPNTAKACAASACSGSMCCMRFMTSSALVLFWLWSGSVSKLGLSADRGLVREGISAAGDATMPRFAGHLQEYV